MLYNWPMKVAFYTLGCKVNQYETEALKEKFVARGFEVISSRNSDSNTDSDSNADSDLEGSDGLHGPDEGFADIYVINTCTVTNLADRKSRQFIRRAKRENPDALVVVTGCYAQVDPEAVSAIEGVDLIVGTNEKQNLIDYAEEELKKRKGIIQKASLHVLSYDELNDYHSDGIIQAMESRTRAYVKIQEGCNRFCSYCIIPYARGRVRSRDEAEIIEEVRGLVDAGFKEIVLTGINTALYGAERAEKNERKESQIKDLAGDVNADSFALRDLLKRIDDIPGDFRIRLSSLEPTVVKPKDVESILDSRRLCPHLHLSIQSGSDNVLRAMNRRYTRSEYLEIVKMLRERNPQFGITTDIIVGFPGETEEDFQDTIDLVRTAGFSKVHVFRYSPRKGTKAAAMDNQIPSVVKSNRAQVLAEEADKVSREFSQTMIGQRVRVLLEERDEDTGMLVGYSDNYTRVYVHEGRGLSSGDFLSHDSKSDGCLSHDCPSHESVSRGRGINEFAEVILLEPYRDGLLGKMV